MPLEKLTTLFDIFDDVPDPADRTDLLLSYADQFKEVPPEVATRPFPRRPPRAAVRVRRLRLGAKQPDGTLKLHFAVENPSGVSAKALAAILDKTLSGLPAAEIATVDCDIVERIFRQNISMGKGMGLMSMVEAVRRWRRRAALLAPRLERSVRLQPDSRYACRNVRLNRPGPSPAGAVPGRIRVTP